MNNVAALQNQLALDVAQRMQSIEDLLDGKNAAPTKPEFLALFSFSVLALELSQGLRQRHLV